MQRKEYLFIFLTALIPIVFWNFYWYVGFDPNYTKLFLFIFGLILLVKYLPSIIAGLHVKTQENQYTKLVSLFIVVILISILNAFFYWGQSPDLTYRSGASIFVLVTYFYFLKRNPSQDLLEKTVFFLAGIYFILWLYALSQAPTVVFGNLESVQERGAHYRILQLAGLDTIVFTYFYCISHLSEAKKSKKLLMIIVAILCFTAVFLSLTRMLIIALLTLTVFYIVRKKSIFYILAAMAVVIASSEYILSNEIVESLLEMTSDSSFSDLRVPEYSMAFKLYPFHFGTFLFGNGSEHIASSYGQMEDYLKSAYAFNRSDAGFVGIYVTYGVVGLCLLFSILWKVVKQKVTNNNFYLKIFVYFVFLVNLTAYHFADYGFTLVLSLYLLSRDVNKNYTLQ